MLAIHPRCVGAGERALADAILSLVHHRRYPQIDRRDRPVGVLADDDVAFLRAQHMHRFGAVRRDPMWAPRVHQDLPHMPRPVSRYVDFIGELAGKTYPRDPRVDASDCSFAHAHERKRRGGEIDIGADLLQHCAALRSRDSDRRPMVGDRSQIHVHMRPLGLQPSFHPGEHARCATGSRRHQEMVLGQMGRNAVVHYHSVFAQHQAVAAAADGQVRPAVAIYPVEQVDGVRPLDVDLAQCRRIENAGRVAHRDAFAPHRIVHGLARRRVVPRALPLTHIFELRAVFRVPDVQRGLPDRFEKIAQVGAGQCAESNRRVIWTKRGGPGCGDRLSQRLSQNRHPVDVAQLTLVGAEAQRGVALDVFD